MKTETEFDINVQDYFVHRLGHEDIGAIQALCEKCVDYMLLVDGHPAEPNGVEEDFLSIPAGKAYDDKFVFGIMNQQKEMIGLLETLRWYPDEKTWWIGLLLFTPETRSQGMGQKVIQGFVEYVKLRGAQAIMLGVVEENTLAYKFWEKMGFVFVRKTEPRKFGNKTQTVSIMCRSISDGNSS
jgi:ribosomal protein S18 acetylase RimI-like enzyme